MCRVRVPGWASLKTSNENPPFLGRDPGRTRPAGSSLTAIRLLSVATRPTPDPIESPNSPFHQGTKSMLK